MGDKPRISIRAIKQDKLTEDGLRASLERLHKIQPLTTALAKLTTKVELIRAMVEWFALHGDPEECSDCTVCGGVMDLRFMDSGQLPPECVYCGETAEDEEGNSPISPQQVQSALKKMSTDPKVEVVPRSTELAKTADRVAVARASQPDAKRLVEEIETIRNRLAGAVQAVHTEMWNTGKWLAELKSTGRWACHPDAFPTWDAFVTSVFGGLVTSKRAGELIAYFQSNGEKPPAFGETKLALPSLPRVREQAAAAGQTQDPPAPPPGLGQRIKDMIFAACRVKPSMKLALMRDDGEPSQRIADRPFAKEELPNGIIQTYRVGQDGKGNLELTIRRERA